VCRFGLEKGCKKGSRRLVEMNSVVRNMRMFCFGGAGRRYSARRSRRGDFHCCDWEFICSARATRAMGGSKGIEDVSGNDFDQLFTLASV